MAVLRNFEGVRYRHFLPTGRSLRYARFIMLAGIVLGNGWGVLRVGGSVGDFSRFIWMFKIVNFHLELLIFHSSKYKRK